MPALDMSVQKRLWEDYASLWPLNRIMIGLNYIGGYPFKIDLDHPDVAILSKWEIPKVLILILIQFSPYLCTYFMLEKQTGTGDINYFFKSTGIDSLDMNIYNVNSILSAVATLATFIIFLVMRKSNQNLYTEFASVASKLKGPSDLELRSKRQFKRYMKALIVFMLQILTVTVCLSTSQWLLYAKVFPDATIWFRVLALVCNALAALTIISPMLSGAACTVCDHVWAYEQVMALWTDTVLEIKNKKDLNEEELDKEMTWCCSFVMDLTKLGRQLNKVTSPFLVVLYGAVAFFTITYCYSGFSMFFSQGTAYKVLFSLSNFILALLFFCLLFFSCLQGQELADQRQSTVRALEDLGMEIWHRLSAEQRAGLHMNIKRMDECGKIVPFYLFEVSNGSLFGILSTLATYLIVLLQFKAG